MSLVDSLDPRTRLLAVLPFAGVVALLERPLAVAVAVGGALIAAVVARLAPRATLRRLLAVDGLMLLALGMLPFTVPGETVTTVAGQTLSREGLIQASLILGKANAVVLMLLALLESLPPPTLGRALARLGLSDKLTQLILFTLRYIDVLRQEYERLRTAMRARAFVLGTNRHTWRSVGFLFGMLMVRTLERSDRVLAAMRCRGFDGRFPSLEDDQGRFRRRDGLFLMGLVGGLVVLAAIEIR